MTGSSATRPKATRRLSQAWGLAGLLVILLAGVLAAVNWRKTNPRNRITSGPDGVRYLGTPRGQPVSLAFAPDGGLLACGGPAGVVELWDITTAVRRTTWTGLAEPIQALAFSPDGAILASGGGRSDGPVRLWDVSTGTERAVLSVPQPAYVVLVFVTAIAFSP